MSSDAAKLHQVHQSEGNFTGYFGKTLWSSSTSTLVQKWSAASGGNVPSNAALIGGREADGTRLYLARGAYLGGIQIGKVRPRLSGMSIGYGGQEIMVPSYEVLISDGQTRTPAFGDNVPAAALQIGREKDGTPLYAAIVPYLNGVHLGKVRPGFTGASIGYGGKEVMVTSYYVLVGYQ
jgi:hypothetical protein